MKRQILTLLMALFLALTLSNIVLAAPPTIREIQQILQQLGFTPGPADGVMGKQTREALKQFQRQQNIEQTGRTDQRTLDLLNNHKAHSNKDKSKPFNNAEQNKQKQQTVKHHMYSKEPARADIKEMQQRLNSLGYNPGPADGVMGKQTREALKRFQKDRNLPVTNHPDEQTMGALRENRKQLHR